MKNIDVVFERQGDSSYTRVNAGHLIATVEQVGANKTISIYGRGNVRQMKAIAREIHKANQ
ncbi:hypothetical protein ACHY88_001598 [Escherichia coli]